MLELPTGGWVGVSGIHYQPAPFISEKIEGGGAVDSQCQKLSTLWVWALRLVSPVSFFQNDDGVIYMHIILINA